MDDYGISDAIVDLDDLDARRMDPEERSECIARIRGLLHQLQQASVLMDDGS